MLNRIDYLLVRDKNIPPIIKWTKEGVIILEILNPLNLDLMFQIDSGETICLVEDYLENCEHKKHKIQLSEVKNYLLHLNEFCK